ncbi:ABC transporter permease [Brooklawnia cerclae]|uniref:Simple sugar transport system permease protein n=1 Tax=Brooklawnia cerclae TaxID=349934 RepID=A0ABX0SAF2_9ACTN|nr:ABC transporter permease [Brooklawnia cerclae]NIH55383.1 simple sugar transport system permease protein [Brooklawnia cerclae]
MSSTTAVVRPSDAGSPLATAPGVLAPVQWRWPITGLVLTLLTVAMGARAAGTSVFAMTGATPWFTFPDIVVPSRGFILVMALLALIVTAVVTWLAVRRRPVPFWAVGLAATFFVLGFLAWVVAGTGATMPVVRLFAGALAFAVPLVFGSLSGVVCERSGIINMAIEAQMLFGAFAAAVIGSIVGTPWIALIAAPVAGILVALLLAVFTITYRVNHIIVGVVLNMLVLGLTSFLLASVLTGPDRAHFNQALSLPSIPIPVLSGIPVIGPVLFDQNILIYLMYVVVVVLEVMLFRSRWGLRTRAAGEHPRAADTVGIKVNALRWRNVLLGGALAGMGGAMFTVGLGLAFSKNMVAGNGYIALAAMILGRWNPRGAVGAAAFFGFATNLGYIIQTLNSPIPTEFVLMIPYLATVFAVAGFVKSAKPPAAEGIAYP